MAREDFQLESETCPQMSQITGALSQLTSEEHYEDDARHDAHLLFIITIFLGES